MRLEGLDQPGHVLRGQVDVERGAALVLQLREGLLEQMPADSVDDLAVHLDQAPIRVVGEPRVAGPLGEPAHSVVVQPEVEDRVHHPRHRDRRARAHGDEERVVRVAEALAGLLLERGQVAVDLGLEAVRQLAAALRVRAAGVGRDREAGRNGHAELGHLREPDAFASEQVATSLGGLVEVVDEAVRGHALQIFPQVPRLKAAPSVTSGLQATRERATLAKRV